MSLATARGRAAALADLAIRRSLQPLPADFNASLPAGSPMVFNCATCHDVITVPEDYLSRPQHCAECRALIELGWME